LNAVIHNVISTADLQQQIDATKFNNFSWGRYDLEFYGGRCGYVKDDEILGRVTVFLSGKMISTGAKSVPLSTRQLDHTLDLVKNKARQIIKELAPTNPVYYEKLRERLEKIIEEEESRRTQDAGYFNKIREVYNEALNAEKERQKLGFSTQFEFAIFGLLQSMKNDEKKSKNLTNSIYTKVKEEAGIVGWKNKRSSEKKMSIGIYDILSDNGYSEEKTNEVTTKIIELAKMDL
jgi:hypothetical protein